MKRALNGANNKMVSAITGRTIKEEAQQDGKTYDVVAGIRATRLRWLGHILRMPEKRMVRKAVKLLYNNRAEGDLLMDAPATESWEELTALAGDLEDESMATARRKEWRQRVRAIKDMVQIQATKGKGKGKKKRQRSKATKGSKEEEKKKKNKNRGGKATAVTPLHGSEASEEPSEEESEEQKWRPRVRAYKPLRGRITCMDGFSMSVQASSAHVCIPRDDRGPYSAVEVGYPSETEILLLPYSDGMSEICGSAPAMYANVPAEVIREVVNKHHGLRSDSVSLPELVTTGASAAAAAATTITAEAKASETAEERDENGCLWAAAAIPPTTTEESSVTSDDRRSPYSMAHMGAPPPPPPATLPPPLAMGSPISPTSFMTARNAMTTIMPLMPGEMTPPLRLRQVEMSPIEKRDEN